MRKAITILLMLIALSGCKKWIEQKQENALIKAMTDGQWVISSFVQNGTAITDDFNGYKFQYYNDKTVDAIRNGFVDKTGTWDGDISTKTTWANFDNVSIPLSLINGNWHIDDSGWTYVVASQTTANDKKVMRLDKL